MIKMCEWQCPPGLIQRALAEHPIEGNRPSLNRPLENFFYDPWIIKDEYKNTAWQELLETLPCSIGEARVITLQPSESYYAHADIDDRWHLNLQGEESYLIDLVDKQMYQQQCDNRWRHMDAGKLHTAGNFGSIPRIQLVVRELLNHSQFENLINVKIEVSHDQYDYRYKFDKIFSPWLNRKNKERTLDNFSYKGEVVTFKIAEHVKEELDQLANDDFKITLFD